MIPGGFSGAPALAVGGACVFLLLSAVWAHYRFADFDRLPRQFGFTLKPNSYAPAWVMVWMLPAFLLATLAFVVALPTFLPPERINGDPETGAIIASLGVVSAQIFTLWLLNRWANGQA